MLVYVVGFRLQESRRRADWPTQDWVAFLGASYFRAIGALGQYGLSARGVAVDVAAPGPEEFPDFTAFYIAPAIDQIRSTTHGPVASLPDTDPARQQFGRLQGASNGLMLATIFAGAFLILIELRDQH